MNNISRKDFNKKLKESGCRIFDRAKFSDISITRNSDKLNLKLRIIEHKRNSMNWA